MKRWPVILLVMALASASSGRARAADDDVEKARILFNAGAKAYAAGRYVDALDAFRAAHALTPDRPTVLFSLAQAERRQFTIARDEPTLRAAIEHFRKYLEIVTEGGRRADAVVALGELEAIAATLRQEPVEGARAAARIMVTTATEGAVIAIDGKRRDTVPVIETIPPGDHKVAVSAPGFVDEERAITAVEGVILPVEINLRERPSFLALSAPAGASILIDGRSFGEAPLSSAIELPSGSHQLTVMQRGRQGRMERVVIERGRTTTLGLSLPFSNQRRVAVGLLGASLAMLGAGAGSTAAAIAYQGSAERLLAQGAQMNLDAASLEEYESARSSRNTLSGVAFGTFAASTVLGVAGLLAYFLEDPAPRSAPSTAQIPSASITPLPGGAFLSAGVRF
jgi:hypothetical protein